MNDTIETIKYRDHIIKIYQDPEMPHPRTYFDNTSKMICFSNKYLIGDKHDFKSPSEAIKWLTKHSKEIWYWLLYLYDHSGLVLSFTPNSDRWDSSHVGWLYIFRKDVPDEDTANIIMKDEIQTYNQYLSGEVYGYRVFRGGVEVDSCWGYYGEIDFPILEAKLMVDTFWQREAAVELFMQNNFAL